MGGGYWSVTGTSAAAPVVSGIAGLLKTLPAAFTTPPLATFPESDGLGRAPSDIAWDIIRGLLREVIVYDGNNQPQSKLWYDYDWSNDYWAATPQPATHHDASGMARGRGNLCWIGRWDVSDVYNFDKSSRSFIKYNERDLL